ncbi:hypothetical protein KC19_VG050900 [Ceratodon purpureus]|uniref:Endonuclease/exonuclease/phosphatase domain-containing protein n=1 Tax=Ceratodon purpureus TaxID=3225 RepID=A0A8T0HLY4_CERPU|nr:hypothetical protein KC19_VG050900 [Ceratodon purpureus]
MLSNAAHPTVERMKVDQLTLATFNVQGLGRDMDGVRKRREFKEFFLRSNPKPDILMIHEDKFTLRDCNKRLKQMDFLRGSSYWNEAIYSAEKDSFRAGTGILLSPRLTPLVKSHGIIMSRRAQYLTFQLAPDMVIGIINIYAHNFTNSRIRLWNAIREFELPEAEWILTVDFNMIEDLEDKRGGTDSTGQGHLEFQAWTAMLLQLQLLDVHYLDEFRQLTNIRYTWNNRRHGLESIIFRLDRFYVSPRIQAIGGHSGE